MWFIYLLITFFAWGTADLFYKKGNNDGEEYSHLKTSAAVGIVMGISAFATMLFSGVSYNPVNLLIYLPVSLMYILSMTVGYFGLRYLELSVSSPVQNASGAVSCILLMIVLKEIPDFLSILSIVLVTAGVILLGIFEKADPVSISADRKHSRSFAAILIPVAYCIIDSLGTFFDGWYLDDVASTPLRDVTEENLEAVANISYQLTFFIAAAVILVFLAAKGQLKTAPARRGSRFSAAILETLGQLTYVYAISGNAVVASPVIASYCVCSAALAGLFLKEKLKPAQYFSIALVLAGIIILGITEGLDS